MRFPRSLRRLLAAAMCVSMIGCEKKQVVFSPASPKGSTEEVLLPPDKETHALYAGSSACKACHEAAYAAWEKSNHGRAEREYHAGMDKAAFDPARSPSYPGAKTDVFLDKNGLATILAKGIAEKPQSMPVVRVIGNDPLRQFLVSAPGGKLQVCADSYDPHKNEWFDVFGNDGREPGDWGHWTGRGMNWNSMCASCHNTRLRKNYEPATDSYHTAMAEKTVSCEACHGPMKDHVDWQGKYPHTKGDPTLRKQTRDQMIDTCGACHARRGEITGDLVPGSRFHDHFSLTLTDETDIYHPDGQVRDEDYEYGSFLSSKMFHAGVRCVDCHDPHTGKRLIQGNMLCMRCHAGGTQPPAPVIDPVKHSFHADGSAGNDCTACHMPVTNYMQRHPRHDHGFTIPDPLLTVKHGVPNACNRCHTDQFAEWSLSHVEKWYGEKMDRNTRTRAFLIADARQGKPEARDGLLKLLPAEPIPAWRASICHLLARWVMEPAVSSGLEKALADPSPLVREAAVRALVPLMRGGGSSIRPAVEKLLDDDSRSVRVIAAWAVSDKLDLNSRAGKELIHQLDLDSDQPLGRMRLSQFAYLRGDAKSAIAQIRKAIAWDKNSAPFHHDLAILLSTTGDTPAAITSLKEAIRLDPQNAEYHYKLGLALGETGNSDVVIAALEKTVSLDPSYARAWYNLGLSYNAADRPADAIRALLKAEAVEPSDATIPYARATIHARLGQRNEALAAARRSLVLRPGDPNASRLIQALSH